MAALEDSILRFVNSYRPSPIGVRRSSLPSQLPTSTFGAGGLPTPTFGSTSGFSVTEAGCAALQALGFGCDAQSVAEAVRRGYSALVGNSSPTPQANTCPEGYIDVPVLGCTRPSAAMPGGTPLTVDSFGEAVVGGFGVPALVPAQVSEIIRRCPRGAVLGKDNLCYVKGSIPSSFRKWRPAPRPPITAADAKAIRRADSAKKRVKKLAGKVGYSCLSKGSRRSKK